jgi:hypothetical protein
MHHTWTEFNLPAQWRLVVRLLSRWRPKAGIIRDEKRGGNSCIPEAQAGPALRWLSAIPAQTSLAVTAAAEDWTEYPNAP